MSDLILPCPFPPEWYESQAFSHSLPLRAVVTRRVEYDTAHYEAMWQQGGRIGPYDLLFDMVEILECGHQERNPKGTAQRRRCWQCGQREE